MYGYVTVARIIYSDKASSFEALLIKEDSVSIHDRNLELLAIKIYKTSKALFSLIIIELFQKQNEHQYNLRHNSQFPIPAVNLVYHETESGSFLGPKIWNILPDGLKKVDCLGAFKSWKLED